jgi:hypothetical protein
MATTTLNDQNSAKTEWTERIKLAATIIGVVSPILALATFIGFKPEKTKTLTLEYISKSTLVDKTAVGEKIEVSYNGRKITQLTAISARLENTGSIAIDENDVKDDAYPKLVFHSNILSAEIKSTNREGIIGRVIVETNVVRIKTGLLNPGDLLSLQILLEGDPGEITNLPKVSYRISDIEEPRTVYPSLPTQHTDVAYFKFPKITEYVITIVASVTPVFMIILLWAAASDIISGAFPSKKLAAKLGAIRKLINMSASGKQLQISAAAAFYGQLGPPYDGRARDLILTMLPSGSESSVDYVERIISAVRTGILPHGFTQRIRAVDQSAIFGGIIVFALFIPTALIMMGSWRYLLSSH